MEDVDIAFKWWNKNPNDNAKGWDYLHSRIWDNVIQQPLAFAISAEEVLQATIDFLVGKGELSSERSHAVKTHIQDFLARTGNHDGVKDLNIPSVQLEFHSSQASSTGNLTDYESSEQSMNLGAIDHTGTESASTDNEANNDWSQFLNIESI
ncbi:hypothetical protein AB5N19_08075 [Seiridium cardinale]